MRRALLSLGLVLAACSGDPATGPEPDALAMTAEETAADSAVSAAAPDDANLMTFTIGRESFTLTAGICNTYEDGTFSFALAEGQLETTGRVTATIERFDSGTAFETIIALEGVRDDGTSVTWYAQESVDENDVVASVFGATVQGTATFASEGGPTASGVHADGSFSVSCG